MLTASLIHQPYITVLLFLFLLLRPSWGFHWERERERGGGFLRILSKTKCVLVFLSFLSLSFPKLVFTIVAQSSLSFFGVCCFSICCFLMYTRAHFSWSDLSWFFLFGTYIYCNCLLKSLCLCNSSCSLLICRASLRHWWVFCIFFKTGNALRFRFFFFLSFCLILYLCGLWSWYFYPGNRCFLLLKLILHAVEIASPSTKIYRIIDRYWFIRDINGFMNDLKIYC